MASEILPVVIVVGQNALDIKHLLPEVDASDQAILVTANVKDERPGRRRIVRGRERLLDGSEVRPIGILHDLEESPQRPAGGRMLSCELCHRRFAINFQRSMFPYLGM